MKSIVMLTECAGEDFQTGNFAGLSLRVMNLARLFSRTYSTTVIVKSGEASPWIVDGVQFIPLRFLSSLRSFCDGYDWVYVLVSSTFHSIGYRAAVKISPSQPMVVDAYTPLLFEKQTYLERSAFPRIRMTEALTAVSEILRRGTVFLCATAFQQDYLAGMLSALGNVRDGLPVFCVSGIRSDRSTVKRKSKKSWNHRIVWFGGVYPWLDIRPVLGLAQSVGNSDPEFSLRVVGPMFKERLGFEHEWESCYSQTSTSNRSRIAVVPWVHYRKTARVLRDCSLAVHWSKKGPEDRFSFRTRLLTLLSHGIPTVTNGDDELSDLIHWFGAGQRLNDERSLASTIRSLLDRPQMLSTMSRNTKTVLKFLAHRDGEVSSQLISAISQWERTSSPLFNVGDRLILSAKWFRSTFLP